MKILNPEDFIKDKIYWRGCPDKVPTESTIRNLIMNEKISDDYTYVDMNNACITQHHGFKVYQEIVNILTEKKNKNFIFVAQSINPFIDNLNFYGNKIFTPHASTKNNFISIPHYTVNSFENNISITDRNLFSFTGANTNPVRKCLANLYPNYCKITNEWFDTKNLGTFKNTLINSKFGLCPRGTGLGTLRMWETLASGVVPVIISDNYKFPLEHIIEWENISVTVKESDIHLIDKILKNYSDKTIENMIEKGTEIYNTYFSNDKLHKTILYYL